MSRLQLSLNVSNLEAAVAFYTRLLGTPAAKLRPGYANFAVTEPSLKLVLNAPGNGPAGTINHLGVEVATTGEVTRAEVRLAAQGLPVERRVLLRPPAQDLGPRPRRAGLGVLHRHRAHRDTMITPAPRPAIDPAPPRGSRPGRGG